MLLNLLNRVAQSAIVAYTIRAFPPGPSRPAPPVARTRQRYSSFFGRDRVARDLLTLLRHSREHPHAPRRPRRCRDWRPLPVKARASLPFSRSTRWTSEEVWRPGGLQPCIASRCFFRRVGLAGPPYRSQAEQRGPLFHTFRTNHDPSTKSAECQQLVRTVAEVTWSLQQVRAFARAGLAASFSILHLLFFLDPLSCAALPTFLRRPALPGATPSACTLARGSPGSYGFQHESPSSPLGVPLCTSLAILYRCHETMGTPCVRSRWRDEGRRS